MKKVIRIGIIGMGGFAGSHQREVKVLEQEGECRLICSCDPDLAKFKEKLTEWEYERRGVKVFDDYLKMLDACAGELDMVVIPTPVPLHASMHRACVERGLAVYLEKPPTLNFAEMDDMLAVERQAKKLTQVGFNNIAEETRRQIKRRLADGEFGRLRELVFCGLWKRTEKYYRRANWAGRLLLNNQLVLDFGMGNAMAHQAHNMLFWGGQSAEMDWADVEWVEAEMYRAHAIQGADTAFLRAGLSGNVLLKAVFSHAYWGNDRRHEHLTCEKASIDFNHTDGYTITWNDGRVENITPSQCSLAENHRIYYAYLRGERDRPLTRLADARPFVRLCDLTYIAAGKIHSVPPEHVQRTTMPGDESEALLINDLDAVAENFLQKDEWPSRQKAPWAGVGGRAELKDLPRLREVVDRMTTESGVA